MNAQAQPVTADLDTTRKMLDGIANSFFLLEPHIAKPSCVCQVPDSIRKAVIQQVAEKKEGYANFSVPLFGPHHDKFLKLVVAPRAAIWTYLDNNTVKYAPSTSAGLRTGPRLIPVERFTEIDTAIQRLVDVASESFETFMSGFDQYVQDGIDSANRTFAGHHVGDIFVSNGKYPSASQFRSMLSIDIGEPRPLAVMDIKRYKGASIPVGRMASIAANNMRDLQLNLDGAKREALENAQKIADLIARQTSTSVRLNDKGKEIVPRFSESLIDKARAASNMLKDINAGYGNDPVLEAAADLIADKLASASTTDAWKVSESAKLEVNRAASTASKMLADALKSPSTQASAGLQAGDEMISGFLDD